VAGSRGLASGGDFGWRASAQPAHLVGRVPAALASWRVPLLVVLTLRAGGLGWSREGVRDRRSARAPYAPSPIGSSTCLMPAEPSITV
jgi:hypothetical protein